MKKIRLALALSLVALCAIVFLAFEVPIDRGPVSNATQPPSPATSVASPTVHPSIAKAADPQSALPVTAEPAELQAQLKSVLAQYQAQSAYPPDSQPIANDAELQRYMPEQPSGVALPFPVDGQDQPINLSLQLDKYQYFQGDPIVMALSISGAPANASINAHVELVGLDGNRLLDTGLQKDPSDAHLLTSMVRTDGGNTDDWPAELQALAYVEVNEHRMTLAAPLRFTPPSAILREVSSSQVQQEYLVIPLQLDVQKPGYFFLRANLYSQQTQRALVHLEGEGRLNSGTQTLNLRAHIAALKAGGDAGPYWLKDISIIRGAELGESDDLAGKSAASAFAVDGFAFDTFTDRTYQDPLAEERQALLSQLGHSTASRPAVPETPE